MAISASWTCARTRCGVVSLDSGGGHPQTIQLHSNPILPYIMDLTYPLSTTMGRDNKLTAAGHL